MDSFFDTANRMYKSSKTLHDNSEYHNACYLAGYVIECYAKIVVDISSSDKKARSFSHNLTNLNSEIKRIAQNDLLLATYVLEGSYDFPSILHNWDPGKIRYAVNQNSQYNQSLSTDFQNEIDFAMGKIGEMKLNGLNLQ